MNSADYLTAPNRQRDQPSRQASQSSVVTHRFAVNSSAPRSLLVPGRGDSRSQPRNSDLEASTELPTIEPSHRRGFSSRQDNQRSAQDGVDFEDEFERVADDSPKSIKDGEEEEDDGASIRTQRTRLERRDLSMFDVAALIINKMIGTGIFTTPGLVLSLTANKKVSIILWLVGGIWSFLSILIYVEFGAAFPFNGGELIYLDEVLRRPDLYATVLFSAFFIVLANTTGNALQFAKHVLLAASPEIKRTEDLDQRLITLFAILVLTVVCLIHYFSRNSGLLLNLLFAAYKIILIVVFIIAGGIAYRNATDRKNDWNDQPVAKRDALAALIYIIYSYQGWENANYVGGELRVARSDLKWGAFMAVGIVTTLYTLVTMAYALACPFQDLVNQDLGIVTHFAPAVFKGSTEWVKVCIALSAFGNLIAVVYTSSKVKQQIARQRVIPFFRFFSKEDTQFETPVGALILHWTFALIWIIATPNTAGGYGFVIGIFIYGQLFVALCMGVAFFFLRRTYEGRGSRKTPENAASKVWKPVIFTKSDWFGYPVAGLFIGINMMVLVESARGSMLPHRWLWPIIFFGTMLLASVYWAAIRIIARVSNKKGKKSPLEIRIVKIVRGGHTGSIDDEPALKQAKLEGNNRIVVYELHGKAKNLGDTINMWGYKLYKLVAR